MANRNDNPGNRRNREYGQNQGGNRRERDSGMRQSNERSNYGNQGTRDYIRDENDPNRERFMNRGDDRYYRQGGEDWQRGGQSYEGGDYDRSSWGAEDTGYKQNYGGAGREDDYGSGRGRGSANMGSGAQSQRGSQQYTQGQYSDREVTQYGRYTGRGPQGWQRSNERITEDVCERLAEHGEIDATHIRVNVENGLVTLEGTVEDRRQKRMAEDIVESIFGVNDVQNNLRVQRQEGEGQSGGSLFSRTTSYGNTNSGTSGSGTTDQPSGAQTTYQGGQSVTGGSETGTSKKR